MSRVTIPDLLKKKEEGRKLTMLTAYDFPFAQMVDEAGIDMILIGDSLGVVVQGHSNTLSVTMEDMLYHTRMVARGVKRALVIGDMPFRSFQPSVETTIRNACSFLQAGASAVKLEGGAAVMDRIRALAEMDIPVMGHVGLRPQAIHRMGGYKVQGREASAADLIKHDARAVEEAGAFAVVLEGIPLGLGKEITESLRIPTIGIGAGSFCDGQVLVLHDLLGLSDSFHPTFVRTYAHLKSQAVEAIKRYKADVEQGKFPSNDESYQ